MLRSSSHPLGGRSEMAITHRPGANQGIGAQIKNEVKLHPIASIGVVALVGLGIWALATRNQGTPDQTATPSDSFWQGYSTAQEDYLQTLSNAYYSTGAAATAGSQQTPGSVNPDTSGAAGTSTSTNSVFTPAYTTDITPNVPTTTSKPTVYKFAGTKVPKHHQTPKKSPITHKPKRRVPGGQTPNQRFNKARTGP